ncbi:hypothetical protein AQI88_01865 [Streptomyces cellostaticus]|uniref:Uncharacterized protein n=1 Tax=Streptomyces cellostaticus TaxID=67285 RepID=A0A101NSQ6_9ACTN|nr:hypothetical protein [Streptomyces cellostaticus]KUM98709.1 hypothetical protein AQI88_01865 [Streptomyces cellostaticus]GHI03153.1 hypothetical protein Scel_14740 [Streptomyces cellostaticus]
MPAERPETRLAPYARLPRTYRDRHIIHSSVDAFGRAHWLLGERPPEQQGPGPYDALVVTVAEGACHETYLSAVLPWRPRVEALPDGGFVLAAARSAKDDEQQVQVFDALGRGTRTFRVGDAIEHLLADGTGELWLGYFDEGIYGDALSAPGLRRWSITGEPLWSYSPVPGAGWISDCYTLNVAGRTAWACPYTHFPLLEVGEDQVVRARENPVRGATGLAVQGERAVFFGGYRDDRNRIVDCRLTNTSVEPVTESRLVRPDGGRLGRRRIVSRGSRLYVQVKPFTEWFVLDLA